MYYQLNIDYIIEKYCVNTDKPELQCNGKCHLAKQLSAIDNNENDSKAINNLLQSFFPVFSEQLPTFELENLDDFPYKKVLIPYNQIYSFDFDYSHFKPPIV